LNADEKVDKINEYRTFGRGNLNPIIAIGYTTGFLAANSSLVIGLEFPVS
jgi:hypothetical protein